LKKLTSFTSVSRDSYVRVLLKEITKFGINLKHIDQQPEDTEDTASYSSRQVWSWHVMVLEPSIGVADQWAHEASAWCLLSDTAAGVRTWPAEALIDPVPYLCSLDCPSQPVVTAGGGTGIPKKRAWCGWGDML
jgi:hypothetical protein